jgi:hypothetical protein
MNQAMMLVKMKSTVAVGITMLSIFSAISAAYDGQVKRARLFCAHARVTLTIHVCVQEVARLPFEPVFFAQVFTRRGLDDNHDVRACSMLFLYMISSMVPPLIPPAHTDFTTHLAPKFPPHYSRATYSLRLAHVSLAFWGAPVVAGHPREFAEVFGERNQLSVSPARNSPPWMHTSRVHARMHSCALIHPTVALLAQCVHMPQSPRTLRGKTCTYAVPPSADLLRRRRRARWACFLGQHRPRAMHLGVDAMAGS